MASSCPPSAPAPEDTTLFQKASLPLCETRMRPGSCPEERGTRAQCGRLMGDDELPEEEGTEKV